jgi:hypothetical protein
LLKKKLLIVQEFQFQEFLEFLELLLTEYDSIGIPWNYRIKQSEFQAGITGITGITGIPGIPWNNCINWAENYD